jgi:hypothetical protein
LAPPPLLLVLLLLRGVPMQRSHDDVESFA